MIKNILWDFDGVILDSMNVRDWGFEEIFKKFSKGQVTELLEYHNKNGGLSRYVKIRYFFEKILNKPVTEEVVLHYAEKFSFLMKKELINPKNLIDDSLTFIKKNHTKFNFHIVSGSDQKELRFLCKRLDIATYFQSINGSPTPKTELVYNLLNSKKYLKEESCLIGDSINDYEAADNNNIVFFGYNNTNLKSTKGEYIESFENYQF